MDGREPRPDRADEVMVSFTLAAKHHLGVGGTLQVSLADGGATAEEGPPTVFAYSFRIVGIEASANEFPPRQGSGDNNVWATPAFEILGLEPGQVRATVAWQLTSVAVVAVLLGVPLGTIAARWAWLLFAHQLGIAPEPVVPLLALAALSGATVVVANLVAVLPGRIAASIRPAVVLRSE